MRWLTEGARKYVLQLTILPNHVSKVTEFQLAYSRQEIRDIIDIELRCFGKRLQIKQNLGDVFV